MFPSHIGSRSTKVILTGHLVRDPFPSHIGSRSTLYMQVNSNVAFLFPSHIGSRSTLGVEVLRGHDPVSIPHWFSLNSKSWTKLWNLSRFHPTLVLAQPRNHHRKR